MFRRTIQSLAALLLLGSAAEASDIRRVVTGLDADPSSSSSQYEDPVLSVIRAPLSSAMTDLYARVLKWRVEEPYQLLNGRVNSTLVLLRSAGSVQSAPTTSCHRRCAASFRRAAVNGRNCT